MGNLKFWWRWFFITEDKEEDGYPSRSHDCKSAETEFADDYEVAQQDLESREENLKKKGTMVMWKHSLAHIWENLPTETTQKLIDCLPKVMKAIIDADWGKTSY